MSRQLNKEQVIHAFNQWMEEFIDNEDQFSSQSNEIEIFIAEKLIGQVPTYGNTAYATLEYYIEKSEGEKYVCT